MPTWILDTLHTKIYILNQSKLYHLLNYYLMWSKTKYANISLYITIYKYIYISLSSYLKLILYQSKHNINPCAYLELIQNYQETVIRFVYIYRVCIGHRSIITHAYFTFLNFSIPSNNETKVSLIWTSVRYSWQFETIIDGVVQWSFQQIYTYMYPRRLYSI